MHVHALLTENNYKFIYNCNCLHGDMLACIYQNMYRLKHDVSTCIACTCADVRSKIIEKSIGHSLLNCVTQPAVLRLLVNAHLYVALFAWWHAYCTEECTVIQRHDGACVYLCVHVLVGVGVCVCVCIGP